MKLLLDTHALLWAMDAPERLSRHAREVLTDSENQVSVSSVSLWEIAIKVSVGRLALAPDWAELIESARLALRARWLLLNPRHCHEVAALPWHHRDPFDRMLIAQAATEGMILVSCDENVRKYEVDVLW